MDYENSPEPLNKEVVPGVKKTWVEQLVKRLATIYDERYSVLDDDSHLIPPVKKALIEHGISHQIGGNLSSIGLEHSIRHLGESQVIKIAPPEDRDIMQSWVKWINDGHRLLKKFVPPQHLLDEQVILVPLENDTATYVIIADFVKGRSLFESSDKEIFNNPTVVRNLLSFFESNARLYEETGLCADIGSPPSKPFRPRYTDNVFIREFDKQVIVTDSILIPKNFNRTKMPRRYFFGPVWYFVYDNLTRHVENRFRRKLGYIASND